MSDYAAGWINGAVVAATAVSILWALFILWRDDRRSK